MKRIIFFIAVLMMGSGLFVQAQPGPNPERIQALKVAFITRQVQLTEEEAQKFWPIYNRYEDNMKDMLKSAKAKGKSEIEIEEQVLELHKKYKPEFLRAISEEKFDRLMKAEKSWGEMLRRELNRRQGGGPGRRP